MAPMKLEIPKSLSDTKELLEEKLKEKGFGVLSTINFSDILENKLGVQIEKTVILGVCNPTIAYEAFKIYPDVGLILPCNITLKDCGKTTLITIANPFDLLTKDSLKDIASQAFELLSQVLDNIKSVLSL